MIRISKITKHFKSEQQELLVRRLMSNFLVPPFDIDVITLPDFSRTRVFFFYSTRSVSVKTPDEFDSEWLVFIVFCLLH
ncbi:hypothetical protein APT59_09830 [Pseudomonas oryzihabitans]|uniref:Uncharacterized protein n=1 Tax=Pseudomonas oryzihabitans TaxID=47885 RepID=A0A0U4W3S4_9PSED|nr:hypothetical protein APT59_09830 [Pseudomonas oryzihabitans]